MKKAKPQTKRKPAHDLAVWRAKVEANLDDLGARVKALEEDRRWMRGSLIDIAKQLGEVKEPLSLWSQRAEATETSVGQLVGSMRELTETMRTRPCVVPGLDCEVQG